MNSGPFNNSPDFELCRDKKIYAYIYIYYIYIYIYIYYIIYELLQRHIYRHIYTYTQDSDNDQVKVIKLLLITKIKTRERK